MKSQENRDMQMKLEVVEQAELANVAGGVGPTFDVSKVEGFKLPSWYLPLSPKLSITTLR